MRRLIIAILAVSIAVSVAGCGTAVPDVRSLSAEQATTALTTAGFKVGAIAYDEKATGVAGAVVTQQPAAGTRAKAGSAVALTIAGPAPVTTPSIIGLEKTAAEAALGSIGLSLGAVTESYDSTAAAGTIAKQDPAAGATAPKGSAVDVEISKGPQPVAIPKVTGKTQAQATSLLQQAGFKVKVVAATNAANKGIVFAQNPASGQAQPGTTVTISVSTGVQLVKVPRVIGMYPDDAAGVLSAAGLKMKEVSIHGPIDSDAGNAQIGQVYRQTPKAGSYVPKGTTITVRSWWESG